MSGGIATERTKEEKSKSQAVKALRDFQAIVNQRIGDKGFHGSLSLKFVFYDGGITAFEVDTNLRSKTPE